MTNARLFRSVVIMVLIGALVLSLGYDRLPEEFERLPFQVRSEGSPEPVVQPDPVSLSFAMDPEVGLEASMFLGGPDLNGDESVNQLDLDLLSLALGTGEGLDSSLDVNRDGMLNQADMEWLRDVAEKRRPGLVSVDFLFDDGEFLEPMALEIDGFGFGPDLEIRVGTATVKPDKVELRKEGPSTTWLFYESLEQAPEQGALVMVRTGPGSSQQLPFGVLSDVVGNQEESSRFDGLLF